MDQEKDPLPRPNRNAEKRKPRVRSSSSMPYSSLSAASHSQRQSRNEDDCLLAPTNNISHHPQEQQQRGKAGKYDHLPLAELLEKYQQQQQLQQQQQQQLQQQQQQQQQEQQQQQQPDEKGRFDHLPLAELLREYQQQQQQQQRPQKPPKQNPTNDASSFTPESSNFPFPVEAAGSASDATSLSFGNDERFLSSNSVSTTTITTTREAKASVKKRFDLLAPSNSPQVQINPPSAVWTTAAVTKTAGSRPRSSSSIAGTGLPSLLESGRKEPLLPNNPNQHHPQQSAWPGLNPSTIFAAPRSSQSLSSFMSPAPLFSYQTIFNTFERNKPTIERALQEMQQILDVIPWMQQMEYATAIRQVPHLVQSESDPIRFLRFTRWDAHAAAHKLVAYWKRRVETFGPERAYLPLTLLSSSSAEKRIGTQSALSKEDVALIKEGFIAYAAYPPFGTASRVHDSDSTKTVVVFDASRLPRNNSSVDAEDDVSLRAFFYHAHCIAENPVSQTEGFVVLCIVQSPQYYDYHTMECLDMLLDVFPVRLKEWHTFDCSSMAVSSLSLTKTSSSSASSTLLGQGYLFAYLEMFLSVLNEYTTYHYSVGAEGSSFRLPSSTSSSASTSSSSSQSTTNTFTPDEIRWELETEHGFTAEEIPTVLGGCWTYDAFDIWLRERMYYERSRYFAGNHNDDVGTLLQGGHKKDKNADQFEASIAYDNRRHDGRRYSYAMGRSSKRSKRDRHPQELMFQNEGEGMEVEEEDGKPRAIDRKQTPMHMIDSDQQQDDGGETEKDASLNDLMHQFQQLFFRDSPTTNAVLPKSSQQHSLAGPTSTHASGQVPSTRLGMSEHQQEQQRLPPDTFVMSSTSPVSLFNSRMNLLNPVALLEKAVDAIPINKKAELMTALQVAPHLVARESDPMRFLVFHEYDAHLAAERLVYYWKIRREWFGDRAYLPMIMSSSSSSLLGGNDDADAGIRGDGNTDGEGALTAEDTCQYRLGIFVITGTDRQGSPVQILDASRENQAPTKVRLRSYFYAYQVLSEYHTTQTPGLASISIWRTNNLDKVSLKGNQILLKAFPIKAKVLHSFDCMEKNNLFHRGFIQGVVGTILRFFSPCKIHFYTAQRPEERERNMQIMEEEYGVSRDLLPIIIGGTWTYDKFDEWLAKRIQDEKQWYHLNDMHMNDSALAIPSIPENAIPLSAAPKTCNQPSERLQSLERAMRHLTTHETKAFQDALRSAEPQIWEDECDPELFVRVEKGDIQKAGERMAKYWQLRSQIFGQEQYKLLTETGENALGRKELKALSTGFLMPLPTDANGQSILFVDLSRLSNNIDNGDRDRCLFYMMSLLTENEKSQTDGAILLHRVHPPDFATIDVGFLEALVTALPLKLCHIHLVSYDSILADHALLRVRCGAQVYTHSGTCKETLCLELELFGMKKSGLPKFVNGDWGYEKFVEWQELRTRIEWKIPAGLSGKHCTDLASFPAMKPYTILEEGKERQRRLNLIRFRRRQNRDRVEIAMLQENFHELIQEKKKLLKENWDLEKRYATASAIMNTILNKGS